MTESVSVPVGVHPASSEEGRAFLQQRIALFSRTAFILSAFFLIGGSVTDMLMHGRLYLETDPSSAWHLTGAAIGLGTWLALRRAPRLGHGVLVAIDGGAVLLTLAAYAMMAASIPLKSELRHGFDLVIARMDMFMLLVTLLVLMLRAMIVPATALHTALVSIAGMIPVHVLSYWVLSQFAVGDPPVTPMMGVVNTALWGTATVGMAAFASRVIYGLHVQVKAAQRLGQYELEEKIGEGGMGSVYRASHALLRRPTAIKLLPPERSGAESLLRFEREVQITSRLTHPNTVAIFDYGHTPEGVFYYAMEYLDGIDLERLVEWHGPQPPARVVHVLMQVCGSLTEAHGFGLVHRDIKPANIILCERGGIADVAKVVDFGLVKQLRVAGDASVTTADAILGTPLYLAPEAIKDPDSVDGRADLYALGAVAYFLLTGSAVFDGAGVIEVCAMHLHERPVPPSSRIDGTLPPPLEALVLRCLEKNPDDRPATAAELAEALLHCGVAPWTHRDARAWWEQHADASPARATKVVHGALTIDLHTRNLPPAA
jgi:serine/threonine-protein kinase